LGVDDRKFKRGCGRFEVGVWKLIEFVRHGVLLRVKRYVETALSNFCRRPL
jgi:hypothetical protein